MKEKLFALVGFSFLRNSISTEVMAGLTTFASMSYIMALLPAMIAPLAAYGFPHEAAFTSVCLATIIGTLLMAFLARRPFGQAPGLTLNIFFIETICISMGYPWQFAVTAVLIEGILFILICCGNLRHILFDAVPASLKFAIAGGIGFFVAMIGLKNSGLMATGTIFNHIDTLTNPSSLLFIIGLFFSGLAIVFKIPGGLLLSIIIVSIIGIPLGVTKIPDTIFSIPSSPAPLFCKFSWADLLTPDLWVCVLTMLFFDVFDSLGTIVGAMASSGNIRKSGRIPHMQRIMLSDAIGTVVGACFGCSTVTTYAESATGVAEGGRTGLTALVTALCFVVGLFFSPLFLAIPAAATAPIMVIAGFYLFSSVQRISIARPVEAIPAFLCILLMPITGSITDGIVFGLSIYIFLSFVDNWVHRKDYEEEDLEDLDL